jgi:hypothetical protein
MRIAAAGSLVFALAGLACILRTRYSILLAAIAITLASAYFLPVLFAIPWRDAAGYFRVRYDLRYMFLAMLLFLTASAYTIWRLASDE